MVVAHRVACLKPRFPQNQQKLSHKTWILRKNDFGNSKKYTKTQAESMVFANLVACVKPRFPKKQSKISQKCEFYEN